MYYRITPIANVQSIILSVITNLSLSLKGWKLQLRMFQLTSKKWKKANSVLKIKYKQVIMFPGYQQPATLNLTSHPTISPHSFMLNEGTQFVSYLFDKRCTGNLWSIYWSFESEDKRAASKGSASWSGRQKQSFNFERVCFSFFYVNFTYWEESRSCTLHILGSLHYLEPWRKCPWARPCRDVFKCVSLFKMLTENVPLKFRGTVGLLFRVWITVQIDWYWRECVYFCFKRKFKTTLKLVTWVNCPENVRNYLS